MKVEIRDLDRAANFVQATLQVDTEHFSYNAFFKNQYGRRHIIGKVY